jgi:hypothetical protein
MFDTSAARAVWLSLSVIAPLGCNRDVGGALPPGSLDLAGVDRGSSPDFAGDFSVPPDLANPSSCGPNVDAGTDPCFSGRAFEWPPLCPAGAITSYHDAFSSKSYADAVAWLRQPNTCGQMPNGMYWMARTGVCGTYDFIETQGLGIGVIVHRFYDQDGKLVGAQARDDTDVKCYHSYGLIPECQLVQCEVLCYIPNWTC